MVEDDSGDNEVIFGCFKMICDEKDNLTFDKNISTSSAYKVQLSFQYLDKTFLFWKQGGMSGMRQAFP